MSEWAALWAAQRSLHHADAPEELVKLLFQARHGVGHLVGDPARVEAYIRAELAQCETAPAEPLLEPIGPDWLRLNLRPAAAYGLQPAWVARMMCLSPETAGVSRAETALLCAAVAAEVGLDVAAVTAHAEQLKREPTWLPSHSAAYREREKPAYRVLHRLWEPVLAVLLQVAAAGQKRPLLIALDGRCASGKSTLAAALGQVLGAPVIHTDDYVVPHAQKTVERLAMPGGNCDTERLRADVLLPFAAGAPLHRVRYDCHADRLCDPVAIPATPMLVLEGAYSQLPALTEGLETVRVFVSIRPDAQLARLTARDGLHRLADYTRRWIPLEEAYMKAFQLPQSCPLVLRGEDMRLEEIRT